MRRVITPVVSGTALILLAASVIPIAAHRVAAVPPGAQSYPGVIVAAVTLAVVAGLGVETLRRLAVVDAGNRNRSGVRRGSPLRPVRLSTGREFGLGGASPGPGSRTSRYRGRRISWSCCPWPSSVMWINGIKNMGDSVVVQRLSRRRPRATDFRLVQGSLYANGTGVLFERAGRFSPYDGELGGQRLPGQPYRRGQPEGGICRGRNAGGPGLLAQGDGGAADYSGTGDGRLPPVPDGDLHRRGNPDRMAGGSGPPEGPGSGRIPVRGGWTGDVGDTGEPAGGPVVRLPEQWADPRAPWSPYL